MSTRLAADEYLLLVHLKDGGEVRRFCEVRVKGKDVYIYQPRRGASVKVSYHESGQQHVKIGDSGTMIPAMQLDPTSAILTEENPWSKSLENFAYLLPWKKKPASAVLDLDVPPSADGVAVVQISIGRHFHQGDWTMENVDHVTLRQEIFSVPHSTDGLQVCVRVCRLQASKRRLDS